MFYMSAERRTGRAQTQIFQPRQNRKTKSVAKLIDDTQVSRK